MKKILLFSLLIVLLSTTVQGLADIDGSETLNCAGKLTYTSSMLTRSGVGAEGENLSFVQVQATVGYPSDNLFIVDSTCNILESNKFTYGGVTVSPLQSISYDNETMYIEYLDGLDYKLARFNKSLDHQATCTLDFYPQSYSPMTIDEDGYVYILENNNKMDIYIINL